MKNKIVISDIDGTLIHLKGDVSQPNINAITKLRNSGVMFVLASGRYRSSVIDEAQKANTSNIVISANGSDVYDFENDIEIYKNRIKYKKIIKIYELCNANNCSLILESGFNLYSNVAINLINTTLISNLEMIKNIANNEGITQLVVISNNLEVIKSVKQQIIKLGLTIGNQSKKLTDMQLNNETNYYYVDVLNKNCHKGVGIKKLCKALRIQKKHVITIGDDKNDLDMFKFSGHKVAVNNAVPALKEMADEIIPSCNDDGVSKFLIKHFDL